VDMVSCSGEESLYRTGWVEPNLLHDVLSQPEATL
jgi:hypothetical protein